MPKPVPSPDRSELKPLERSIFGSLANLLLALWERIQNAWFRWASLNQHAPWFPLLVGSIVAVDAIIVVLPGDIVVALALFSNPKAWRKLALYSGIGGALGAFVLYLLVLKFGKGPLDHFAALAGQGPDLSAFSAAQPDIETGLAAVAGPQPPKWELARAFFNKYGLFSLALGSVVPLFSWPPVILAGLSTDRWWEVLFWLLIGRQARYWLLCFGLREGWAMFRAIKEEAVHKREEKVKQGRQ